jgi:hypothetical protein
VRTPCFAGDGFDIYGVFRLHFVFGFADDYVPLKMTALGWMGTATQDDGVLIELKNLRWKTSVRNSGSEMVLLGRRLERGENALLCW